MDQKHLKIAGDQYTPEQIVELLNSLGLLPILIRKQTERVLCRQIKPSEEEQTRYQQYFLAKEKISTAKDLDLWLDRNGVDEAELSKRLLRALQLDQMKHAKFGSIVNQVFLERKSSLDMAMYSMIRCKSKAKATEIYTRILDEEDTFADLASEFSEGQEQKFNGLIGPLELGKINPDIAERLRVSNAGQLWPPFEQNGWWVLLRLEKLLPAQLDKSMHQRIINEKYEEWIRSQVLEQLSENKEYLNRHTTKESSDEKMNINTTTASEDEEKSNDAKKQQGGVRTWLRSHFK